MKNSKAILQVPGTMKIISAEIPVPKEDEVLIKVEYVGICGSDVHGFESGPFIPPKDPNQEIGLGHECAGTVVAVGSRVRKFKPGDRVNIEPGVPCGHCRYCLEGKYNICPDVDFMATQPNYRGARCQQFTEDMGADIVFETAGSAVTVKQAPYLVMRGGKIMIVGTVPGDSAINFLKINREVTIQTVFRYANRYPVTIEAISSGRFDVKSMVTHIYDYRDVQQAFEESVNNKRDIIKGVIKISD